MAQKRGTERVNEQEGKCRGRNNTAGNRLTVATMLSVIIKATLYSETVRPLKVPQNSQIHDRLILYFLLYRRGDIEFTQDHSVATRQKQNSKADSSQAWWCTCLVLALEAEAGADGCRSKRFSVRLRPAWLTYQVLGLSGLHRETCVKQQQKQLQTQRQICKSRTHRSQ